MPLELQDLFIKRDFAERYGFTPEQIDNLSMRHINGFKTIELEQEKYMKQKENENPQTNQVKNWQTPRLG